MKWPLLLTCLGPVCVALATPGVRAATVFPDWIVQAATGKITSCPANTVAVVLLDDRLVTVGADGHTTVRERRVLKILRPPGPGVCRDCRSLFERRKDQLFPRLEHRAGRPPIYGQRSGGA